MAIRAETKNAIIAASSTLTTPKIVTSINDANGNEVIKTPATSSAVNEITVTNAATGNAVSIAATGNDTNIGLVVSGKGTGSVKLGQATCAGLDLAGDQPIRDSSGNELIKFTKATSEVNELTVANAATGTSPSISATGDDTNISIKLVPKGTGRVVPSAPNLGFTTVTTINTAGAASYTAAQVLGGLINRDPNGGARTDVLPAADALVAAIPGAVVGTSFLCHIRNTADAAEALGWNAGTGGTFADTATITQKQNAILLFLLTNVTGGTEAYTAYIVSTGTFMV